MKNTPGMLGSSHSSETPIFWIQMGYLRVKQAMMMWIFATFCRSNFPRETMGCPHVFVSLPQGKPRNFQNQLPFSGCVGKLKWAEKPGWWPKILGTGRPKCWGNLALIWSKAWYPLVPRCPIAAIAGRCLFPCDLSIYPHVVGISSRLTHSSTYAACGTFCSKKSVSFFGLFKRILMGCFFGDTPLKFAEDLTWN